MQRKKKILGVVLAITMTVAMVPMVAFADEVAAKVSEVRLGYVSDDEPGITLNDATPYWKNGADEATNDPTGANATFDADTGTLTLDNAVINVGDDETYAHGIYAVDKDEEGENVAVNLTVKLIGTNTITASGDGIEVFGNLDISGGELKIADAGDYGLYSEYDMTLTGVKLDLTSKIDAIYVNYGLCSVSNCTGTVDSTGDGTEDSAGDGIYVNYGTLSMSGCDMKFEAGDRCLYGYDCGKKEEYNNGVPYGIGDVVIKDCTLDLTSIMGDYAIEADYGFFDIENSNITINALGGLSGDDGTDDESMIKNSTLDINTSSYEGIRTFCDLLIHASDVTIKADDKNQDSGETESCGIYTGGELTITDNPGATGTARHTIDVNCTGVSEGAKCIGIYCEDTLSLSGSILKVNGKTGAVYLYSSEELTRSATTPLVLAEGYVEVNGNELTDLQTIDAETYSTPGEAFTMAKDGVIATQVAWQPSTLSDEITAEANKPTENSPTDQTNSGGTTTTNDIKAPATGDTSDMGLWIVLLALAAGTTTVAYRKKTDK